MTTSGHTSDNVQQSAPSGVVADAQVDSVVRTTILISEPGRDPASLYLARLGPGSVRSMRGALGTLTLLATGASTDPATFAWWTLGYADTQFLRSELVARFAPATARRIVAALKGVLREAWRSERMTGEDYHRACDIAPIRGSRLPAGREVPLGELDALFASCWSDGPLGIRDAAVLAVMAGGGLRRAEIVGLDLVHLDDLSLMIVGKGDKQRELTLPDWTAPALKVWCDLRGPTPGPLFLPVGRAGVPQLRRLSGQAIYLTVKRRVRVGRIADASPHDLRRSWISALLAEGVDLASVSKLAGHAQVQTTAGYDRRSAESRRRATSRLPAPASAVANTS